MITYSLYLLPLLMRHLYLREKAHYAFVARLAASRPKKVAPLAKKLVRSTCSKSRDTLAVTKLLTKRVDHYKFKLITMMSAFTN